MPQSLRPCHPGLPYHLVARAQSRRQLFLEAADCLFLLDSLRKILRGEASLHAWVLMADHFHLLLTPQGEDSLDLVMGALLRRYSRHFQASHGGRGQVWETPWRASPVDSRQFLFACQRYIELNPVRSGLVESPSEYPWSSYRGNVGALPDSLLVPHPEYLALGATPAERGKRYREGFETPLDPFTLERLRRGIRRDAPVGGAEFQSRLSAERLRRHEVVEFPEPESIH